jgi:hypothetical protein
MVAAGCVEVGGTEPVTLWGEGVHRLGRGYPGTRIRSIAAEEPLDEALPPPATALHALLEALWNQLASVVVSQ